MYRKRIFAYIIDYIFITMLVSCLLQIRILNPLYEKNYEATTKYLEKYQEAAINGDAEYLMSNEYKDLVYEMNKTGIYNEIIKIVSFVGYFGIFQYFNKGQTLGQKLMKIKVVNKNETEKLNIFQLLLRNIIFYGLYIGIISILLVNFIDKSIYINTFNMLSLISSIIYQLNIFMILFRKDNCGLHELLSKTKIIQE